jgi:hypothetical protein
VRYDDDDEEDLKPEQVLELMIRHSKSRHISHKCGQGSSCATMAGERDPPVSCLHNAVSSAFYTQIFSCAGLGENSRLPVVRE